MSRQWYIIGALYTLLIMPCCTASEEIESFCATEQKPLLYDLDETTTIILSFIQSNAMATLLEGATARDIELLLKNFSAAEIAFQTEVLNYHQPVVVLFFRGAPTEHTAIHQLLAKEAEMFKEDIHFVQINGDKLFKIVPLARVYDMPTIIFYHNQTELGRLTGHVEHEQLHEWIHTLFDETQLIQ